MVCLTLTGNFGSKTTWCVDIVSIQPPSVPKDVVVNPPVHQASTFNKSTNWIRQGLIL